MSRIEAFLTVSLAFGIGFQFLIFHFFDLFLLFSKYIFGFFCIKEKKRKREKEKKRKKKRERERERGRPKMPTSVSGARNSAFFCFPAFIFLAWEEGEGGRGRGGGGWATQPLAAPTATATTTTGTTTAAAAATTRRFLDCLLMVSVDNRWRWEREGKEDTSCR